ncbi:gas2 domain containing protein [Stylonychia lemnae]|uniref:Gas2 domain containing protein n=1 Tax=Stylonychia lemnae TaxID=5949 RepID=A0A078B1Q2_STYLE|nr:gas2 domain containing protein [Stylonychia lemnae]|eukprot:CDW88231.1 gas2 domain containing protein [Stylonychia lemnae]
MQLQNHQQETRVQRQSVLPFNNSTNTSLSSHYQQPNQQINRSESKDKISTGQNGNISAITKATDILIGENFQTPPKHQKNLTSSEVNTQRKQSNLQQQQQLSQQLNKSLNNQTVSVQLAGDLPQRRESCNASGGSGVSQIRNQKSISRQTVIRNQELSYPIQGKTLSPSKSQQSIGNQQQILSQSYQTVVQNIQKQRRSSGLTNVNQNMLNNSHPLNQIGSQGISRQQPRARSSQMTDYQMQQKAQNNMDEFIRIEKSKLQNINNQIQNVNLQYLQNQLNEKELLIQQLTTQNVSVKQQLELQKVNYQKEIAKHKTFQEIILNENKVLSRQILVLTEMYYEQHRNIQKTYNEKNYEENGLKCVLYDERVLDYRSKYEDGMNKLRDLETKLLQLNENHIKICEDKDNKIQELQSQNKDIKHESKLQARQIQEFVLDLERLKNELEEEKNKKVDIQNEKRLDLMRQSLVENYKITIARQTQQIDDIIKEKKTLEAIVEKFRNENSKTATLFFEKDAEIDFLQKEISQLMKEKSDKEAIIKTLTQENLRIANTFQEIDTEGRMSNILQQEIDYLQQQLLNSEKHGGQIENHLNIIQNAYEESQSNLEQSINQQQELLNNVKEREQELERMSEYLNDLQRINFVYQAAKDDPIDKKLADFINNNQIHKKASLLFVREQDGVYSYGKRRVFIKIEKDQIIIRVGGGFLTIDEFIENYSPYEVRKRQKSQYSQLLTNTCQSGAKSYSTNGTKGFQPIPVQSNNQYQNANSKQPKIISHPNYNSNQLANINGESNIESKNLKGSFGSVQLQQNHVQQQFWYNHTDPQVSDILEDPMDDDDQFVSFNMQLMK